MTHGFNYGTAVFEGIRAYWNADEEQLFGLVPRSTTSGSGLSPPPHDGGPQSPEELAEITVELLRRDGLREDVYVRPIIYKSSETIGVRLHNLDADITIFAVPFGQYIDTEGGIAPRSAAGAGPMTTPSRRAARSPARTSTGAGEERGAAQRLRRGDRADRRRPRQRGSAENLFIVQGRDAHHAAGDRQHPRGDHPRRLIEIAPTISAWRSSSARSIAPSCTSPTRSSSAAPAPRSAR